jgi:Ctr copper transporter family
MRCVHFSLAHRRAQLLSWVPLEASKIRPLFLSPLQTQAQYAGAVIFCICFGWLRHAFARLRQDVAVANNLALTNGGKAKLSDAEIGGPSYGAVGAAAASAASPSSADNACADNCLSNQSRARRLTKLQTWLVCGFLRRHYWALRLLDTFLFGCVSVIGFFNMLVVMAYNPGLMMAIVGGEMLGVLTVEPVGGLHAADTVSDGSCH